ncbi:hypothetical protein [Gordonia insulae]|uniref:Uncharacterized protein n=1 Tax=Gordonia insulae TaxID=2420509 RepID=A0A3G8JJB9_9ACTN|nr:hypothetical protein [Gordonia insulae]AZG44589.1 hypothetical protein D7316_01175 [Gordonia insulae]
MTPEWTHHVIAGATGAVAVNVVPHLAHAVAGKPFPTPFADPPGVGDSPPGLNVVWASMNATAAAALLRVERNRLDRPVFWGAFGLGASAAALGLRSYFGRVRGTST